jgi:cysteinyl-tRNA synthetase
MSKSKGEFLTVSLLKSKGYDPVAYRFFCLQSHYRKPLTFSYSGLDNAVAAYAKLKKKILNLDPAGEVDAEALAAFRAKFSEAVGNDMNTAQGLTVLYDVLKAQVNGATKLAIFDALDTVLSLNLTVRPKVEETPAEPAEKDEFTLYVEEMIAQRAAAKKAKDYAKADAIRAELKEKGVTLIDTPQGTTFKKD